MHSDRHNNLPLLAWWQVAMLACYWILAAFGGNFLGAPIFAFCAALMPASIYLALQSNFLLLQKIKKQGLDSEEELQERMLVAARQEKLIKRGFIVRIIYYGVFFILFSRINLVIGQPDYFAVAFQFFTALIIADMVAAVITLLIAYVRGDKENVLYSGEIPDDIMTSVSNKRGFSILGDQDNV